MQYRILSVLQRTGLVMTALSLLAAHSSRISNGSAAHTFWGSASTTTPLPSQSEAKAVDPATRASIAESYGKLPLSFEANNGQVDDAVKFLSRGNGYTLFLTSTEAVLSLRRGSSKEKQQIASKNRDNG